MGAGAGGGMGGGYGLPSPYMYPQQQPSYSSGKGGQGPMYSQSPFGGGGSRYKSYNSYSQPNQFYGNNYGMGSYPAPPKNPFEGNEQYQALMDYQKSMGPTQEQMSRYGQLQRDFEQSSGFKDYRIKQLEDQQNLIRNIFSQSMMGGIGAYRDQYGPSMRRNFGGFTQRPTTYSQPYTQTNAQTNAFPQSLGGPQGSFGSNLETLYSSYVAPVPKPFNSPLGDQQVSRRSELLPVQTRYIPQPYEFQPPPEYVVPNISEVAAPAAPPAAPASEVDPRSKFEDYGP